VLRAVAGELPDLGEVGHTRSCADGRRLEVESSSRPEWPAIADGGG
jgi:hypothetical protein